jgi:phosphocarrier protein HPr
MLSVLKQEIEIINKLGLHARASAKLTQTAGRFQAEIFVSKAGKRVNAKSIMGVMMLAAGKGSKLELEASGADEGDAMGAVVALINDKFGEGE